MRRLPAPVRIRTTQPSVVKLTISGRAGGSGAVMQGLPGNPTADPSGFYRAEVEYGWTGDITPIKDGYEFDPPSVVLTSLANDMTNKNFKAKPITYTISGNVGLKGVVLRGLPGSPVSDDSGSYSAQVQYKFSGSVTPTLSGYQFDPPTRDYVELTSSLPGENYRHSIIQHVVSGRIIAESGSAEGIFIRADNEAGSTTTDAGGNYELSVSHGWRGTITPMKEGYTFTPASRQLNQIYQPRPNVTFIGKVKMLTITDSIFFDEDQPIQDVLITSEPGGATTMTGADGKYRIQVPYGWSGELIPTKEGFNFYPPSKEYLVPVTQDIDNTSPKPSQPVTPPADTTTTTPPADTATTAPPADTTTIPPADTTTPPPADTTTTTPPADTTSLSPDLAARRKALMEELAGIDAQRDATTPPVGPKPDVVTTLPPIDNRAAVQPPARVRLRPRL